MHEVLQHHPGSAQSWCSRDGRSGLEDGRFDETFSVRCQIFMNAGEAGHFRDAPATEMTNALLEPSLANRMSQENLETSRHEGLDLC